MTIAEHYSHDTGKDVCTEFPSDVSYTDDYVHYLETKVQQYAMFNEIVDALEEAVKRANFSPVVFDRDIALRDIYTKARAAQQSLDTNMIK